MGIEAVARRYVKLRNRYRPRRIRAVFLLESPPVSGKYFYEERGRTSEPLFRAMMGLLDLAPASKPEGLRQFQNAGYLLVDAVYYPVNGMSYSLRDATISRNVPNLVRDLRQLGIGRLTPLVLVKTNVYRLLNRPIVAHGFNVLNGGTPIPFPSHGWQKKFHVRARRFLVIT